MKFTGSFALAEIDINKYKELLRQHLVKELKRVAGAWFEGAILKIPVWSGMSQASLLELVDLLNGTLLIEPIGNAPNRIAKGMALGTATLNQDFSDFNITIVTDVPHYNVQEYRNVGVSKSAPWHSLEAGQAAASEIIKTVRLIAPEILSKRIKV